MKKRQLLFILLAVSITPALALAQRPLPIVEQIEAGMVVTTQGCVKPAQTRNEYVFTQVMTWPIVRTPEGPYGPRHFAIQHAAAGLAEFVGDTVQMTGRIVAVKKSEIELEPGLHRYGTFVEFERSVHNVLVRPEDIGLQLDRRAKRDDISITLLDYEVDNMIRVMRGCLTPPGAAAATNARRR